jgi:hypothetical protein
MDNYDVNLDPGGGIFFLLLGEWGVGTVVKVALETEY